jgi:polyhydroxyalkanoate synthase
MKQLPTKTAGSDTSPETSSIAEIFADLNAIWMSDPKALSDQLKHLHEAMGAAAENINGHGTAEDAAPRDTTQKILDCVGTLARTSQQYHRVFGRWMIQYIEQAPRLDGKRRELALFWIKQFIEMASPANCFWTNLQAVKTLFQSEGQSLVRGMQNWMSDLHHSGGLVALADPDSFVLGSDLAATPGRVVFRNAIMEVIQYAPQTDTVWQTPIVMIQPWINKYYIFDLSARNSFVAYLVRQGYTVFITSWKNPGPDMQYTRFDDYMFKGVKKAIRVACHISGASRVHAAGYCIGGTALAALAGWMAGAATSQPIGDITLFATLLDFSYPGDMAALVNPETVQAIRNLASTQGILQAHQVASAFRLLKPGDLIWRYVINNYFCGERPPRSDMLFWNNDGTRLPAAMCRQYLESFYLKNRLAAPNALRVGGRPIDLRRIKQPLYNVGAAKDHICPWPGTFRSCRLTGGKVRYVLADEGHITGIVNPPSPWSKKTYLAGAATHRTDTDKWKAKQAPEKGSWWPDWTAWLKLRSGRHVNPPPMGNRQYPALEPAPGTYVLEK